jgi:hypothetical protein
LNIWKKNLTEDIQVKDIADQAYDLSSIFRVFSVCGFSAADIFVTDDDVRARELAGSDTK